MKTKTTKTQYNTVCICITHEYSIPRGEKGSGGVCEKERKDRVKKPKRMQALDTILVQSFHFLKTAVTRVSKYKIERNKRKGKSVAK